MSRQRAGFRGHSDRPTYIGTAHAEVALWLATVARGFRGERNTAGDVDEACTAWLQGRGFTVTKESA